MPRFVVEYEVEARDIADAVVGLTFPAGEPTEQKILRIQVAPLD